MTKMFTRSKSALSSDGFTLLKGELLSPTTIANAIGCITCEHTSDICNGGYIPDTPTVAEIVLSLEGAQGGGVPTKTTATLTPTATLPTVQNLFELAPESHSNQAGFVPPQVGPNTGAFMPVETKPWQELPIIVRTQSLEEHAVKAPRKMGGRRPIKDDRLSPEEEERRRMRRERNKLAAARCRKKRLDQTTCLQEETDILESRRSQLRQEIEVLREQKEQLQYLLETHKEVCQRNTSAVHVKVEVKEEIDETPHIIVKPQRPTSLAVAPILLPPPMEALETPSNILKGCLNFESMLEGGTGLTPISLTPISLANLIPSGLTPLSTPTVSLPSSNCGSQQRSTVTMELSSPDSVPMKLVSL